MLADVEIAGELFARVVGGLTEADLRSASAMPGWSRAHVAAHVALNAEGFVAAAGSLAAGDAGVMYPGGVAERDHDIEALASAPREQLVDRLRHANRAFLEAWDPEPPPGECATAEGHPTFSSATVPQRRLRELQVHLLDLDCPGVSVDDWTTCFVDVDLPLQWPTVAHRTTQTVTAIDEDGVIWDAHVAGDDAAPRSVRRRDLLAWVLDRAHLGGFPTLESWSNRSKWEHLTIDDE